MNEEAQIELKRILAKEPSELTQPEIDFMRARRAYIGKVSRQKFAEFLNVSTQQPQKAAETVKTRGRKKKAEGKIEKKRDDTQPVPQVKAYPPLITDEDEDEDIVGQAGPAILEHPMEEDDE